MTADGDPGTGTVRLSRTLAASPARVWRALTDSIELAAWFWPVSMDTSVEVDLRVGGRYRIAAIEPPIAVTGEFTEVTAPTRLVETWRWDGEDAVSRVTIDLTGDTHTDLAVRHEGLDEQAVESHVQGWSDCFDRLPAHLAGAGD